MKYLNLRSHTWYYRRRVPLPILHLCNTKRINRPLSTDKILAKQLATKYDNLFNMIEIGLRLNQDVSNLMDEVGLNNRVANIDIYEQYLKNQDVSSTRIAKIERLLSVVRVLLPKDLRRLNMSILDDIRNQIIHMPKRNIQKYRVIKVEDLVKMDIPVHHRLTVETANDHLKILNSLLKFAYERDVVSRQYRINMFKQSSGSRDERISLPVDTISRAVDDARTSKLASCFTLLYLTGMRPSEVYKCKITVVDGIKCFDLRDKNISLKTNSSHRLVPVHYSIDEPEQMLEDYRSMSSQYISRQFKVEEGTLYSLRHSFATELASKGVEPYIISELLGHTHNGMTLERYVKGFPTKLLSESINKLDAI